MKPLFRCFSMFMRQILKDSMLFVVIFAPLITAFFFRFAVPQIESLLCDYYGKSAILTGYYLFFDIFVAVITPFMFCFASAMVMLTEFDENMANYMVVTPVGKYGYILSRLIFPAVISVFASIILVSLFSLTEWSLSMLLITSVITALIGICYSLVIVSFSHNRVEGMAAAKLSGIIMLGMLVPFFMHSGMQYLFSLLPSFWISKLCMEANFIYVIPAVLTSLIWIWALYGRFKKKFS